MYLAKESFFPNLEIILDRSEYCKEHTWRKIVLSGGQRIFLLLEADMRLDLERGRRHKNQNE